MISINEAKQIDLREFLGQNYGLSFNPSGMALCPFHNDHEPSLSVNQNNGHWVFNCFGCEQAGSIIDFVKAKEGLASIPGALQKIEELAGLNTQEEIRTIYDYTDEQGKLLYQCVRYNPKRFAYRRPDSNSEWVWNLSGVRHVLYNLPQVIKSKEIYITEGEKDADNLKKLGLVASTNPFGAGHWKSNYSGYLRGKVVNIISDNDEPGRNHAQQVANSQVGIAEEIKIINLDPSYKDVSDWIEAHDSQSDEDLKRLFEEIVEKTLPFQNNPKQPKKNNPGVETIEQILSRPRQEIDRLVDPFIERNGFTLIGGIKGIGKSLFVTNLAFYASSGKSGFLDSLVKQPYKVLLVQQEVSQIGFEDRIRKIIEEEDFNTQNRFIYETTTKNPLKINKQTDYDEIKKLVEENEPDITILDPFATFSPSENDEKIIAHVVDQLNKLKSEFHTALVVTHHFTSKANPEDLNFPTELAGKFRGHSRLSDSADILIGLFRLPLQQKQQVLPLPYENYCTIEIDCRHGQKPEMFAIERKKDSLIFRLSDIRQVIGKKIWPDELYDLVQAQGGEMPLQDIYKHYEGKGHFQTVRNAVNELKRLGKIDSYKLPERGSPSMIRIK